MANESLTREGLIWKLFDSIAIAERKFGHMGAGHMTVTGDRAYQLQLIKEIGKTVDDALKPPV